MSGEKLITASGQAIQASQLQTVIAPTQNIVCRTVTAEDIAVTNSLSAAGPSHVNGVHNPGPGNATLTIRGSAGQSGDLLLCSDNPGGNLKAQGPLTLTTLALA